MAPPCSHNRGADKEKSPWLNSARGFAARDPRGVNIFNWPAPAAGPIINSSVPIAAYRQQPPHGPYLAPARIPPRRRRLNAGAQGRADRTTAVADAHLL